MHSRAYKSFFLLTPPDPGEKEEELTKNECHYLITPQPLIFNARRCIKSRKDREIEIATVDSPKQAS